MYIYILNLTIDLESCIKVKCFCISQYLFCTKYHLFMLNAFDLTLQLSYADLIPLRNFTLFMKEI